MNRHQRARHLGVASFLAASMTTWLTLAQTASPTPPAQPPANPAPATTAAAQPAATPTPITTTPAQPPGNPPGQPPANPTPPASAGPSKSSKSKDERATAWVIDLRQQVDKWQSDAAKMNNKGREATLLRTSAALMNAQVELGKPQAERDMASLRALDTSLDTLSAIAQSVDTTDQIPPPPTLAETIAGTKKAVAAATATQPVSTGRRVTLPSGSDFNYGLTVSLLRYSVARQDDQPARLRNYQPRFEALPAEFGFQFTYHPSNSPWRLRTETKDGYQVMSVGGILLARVDNEKFNRGELGLAATVQFLEDSIGFGVGFDLYRGIPVQGPDGQRGGATAYTGLLGWALARDGEITPENVFMLITVNVAGLAGKISTKESDQ